MNEILNQFLLPALALFLTGLAGAMFKRNLISILMCIELMLSGAILAFAAFSSVCNDMDGGVFAFFIMTIAAAEVAVGLAVITQLHRVAGTVSAREMDNLGD